MLDILLPDGSGLDLCRQLRDQAVPILLLTSLGESSQVIQGLTAGGDDYITKPYRVEELVARVKAHLRRIEVLRRAGAETGSDRFRLDTKLQRAYLDGEDLMLKPKEFLLLSTLVRNRSRAMTAEELYAEVWNMEPNNDLRTVLVHISSLRFKLRQGERRDFPIQIVRAGKGYRLTLGEAEP